MRYTGKFLVAGNVFFGAYHALVGDALTAALCFGAAALLALMILDSREESP